MAKTGRAAVEVGIRLHCHRHDRTLPIYSSFTCADRQPGRFFPLRADLTELGGHLCIRGPVRHVLVRYSCRQTATTSGNITHPVPAKQSVKFVVDHLAANNCQHGFYAFDGVVGDF